MTKARKAVFENPFRPGAGHMPPYLAGRDSETREFTKLLAQNVILENLILTGLRGLGKTVLLETFKPLAINAGWLWTGADLSESTSISDENLALRLITDLSVVTSQIVITYEGKEGIGLRPDKRHIEKRLDFHSLMEMYNSIPGLVIDKLKGVLETVWMHLSRLGRRGLVFAYDEAQNLADHAEDDQFPLSLLLDTFQSIQRKNIPFMLALTGLPTLYPKLVEARTFSERMFHVISLSPLNEQETSEAIRKPIASATCPVHLNNESVQAIWKMTKGYPYFVQFVCRESFDVWVQCLNADMPLQSIPADALLRKLDTDFFAGRWGRATERQRGLMIIISTLTNHHSEFTVQDVVESTANQEANRPFSASSVNQMFATLAEAGLIYKNRHGRYSFAVPLLGDFIRRQLT